MYADPADQYIEDTDPRLVDWLISFIRSFATDRDHYLSVVDEIVRYRRLNEPNITVMKSGIFRLDDVRSYATHDVSKGKGMSFPIQFTSSFLKKLHQYEISINLPLRLPGQAPFDVHLSERAVSQYSHLDCLDNVIRGTNYIISKYSNSLCHIVVRNNGGTEFGATGFVFIGTKNSQIKSLVITNKHVVDPSIGSVETITIRTGQSLDVLRIWISESHDLAAIEIDDANLQLSFNFATNTDYLNNVISLGYPFVARAKEPVMMVHSGQINGFSSTIDGEDLMFMSTNVSPGSSGGPVLNELGLVVGVITQSNEREYYVGEEENRKILRSIHHAAIPAGAVVAFINDRVGVLPAVVHSGVTSAKVQTAPAPGQSQ